MSDGSADVLRDLARVAADLGPALRLPSADELLQSIVEAARAAFDAAACSIALLDEAETELTFRVAAGAGAESVVGMRIPAGSGIAGWAVVSGQPIAIADVTHDPRFAADVAEQTGYVPASIMAMPLETETRTFGVIEVLDRRRGGEEGAGDMELLVLFARQAALVAETAAAFTSLGAAVFAAAARAVEDGDLGAALQRQADQAPRADAELAELSLLFHELGTVGADERLIGGSDGQ